MERIANIKLSSEKEAQRAKYGFVARGPNVAYEPHNFTSSLIQKVILTRRLQFRACKI